MALEWRRRSLAAYLIGFIGALEAIRAKTAALDWGWAWPLSENLCMPIEVQLKYRVVLAREQAFM